MIYGHTTVSDYGRGRNADRCNITRRSEGELSHGYAHKLAQTAIE